MTRLPLEERTLEEKLEAMEALWESLCNEGSGVPAPAWQLEILAARHAAKRSIRNERQ